MDWANLLILLAAVMGHILIVRAAGDQAYRVRIPRWLQPLCTPVLVVFAIAFAVVVVPILALSHPGLAWGAPWSAAPLVWRLYIAICLGACVVGLVYLFIAVRHRRPPAVRSMQTRVFDLAAALGRRPIQPGVPSWIASLPFNDLCRIDMSEAHLDMPRLPRECDGLSILQLTDLHLGSVGTRDYFRLAIREAMREAPDLIALTGDILEKATAGEWIGDLLAPLQAPLGRYFVLGNHDVYGDWRRAVRLLEAAGWTYAGGQVHRVVFRGQPLAVIGTDFPWLGRRVPPAQHRPLPDLGALPPHIFRLLLSHTPHNFGSAHAAAIDLVLAGHLHGGQVRLPLLGPARGGWFNSGFFARGSTLMHVSRGLGQTSPLRFRCRPEISRLVLHAA